MGKSVSEQVHPTVSVRSPPPPICLHHCFLYLIIGTLATPMGGEDTAETVRCVVTDQLTPTPPPDAGDSGCCDVTFV